jgi:Ca-activated chloride channel family protein
VRILVSCYLLSVLGVAAGIAASDADPQGPKLLDEVRERPGTNVPAASIRANVNLTLVPVTVLDRAGRNVTGLARESFHVFDGSERPIVAFSQEDQPISVGLIFDCSSSMTDKFRTSREAPSALFRELNERDEAFLVTVSDSPNLRMKFTSNFNDIGSALVFTNPHGSTSLLDGVYLGLSQMKKAHNTRHALIVVSDGGDNNSRYTLRELTRIAAESDTEIFTIGLHQDPRAPEEVNGPALLAKLSAASGGMSYDVRDPKGLSLAMGKIGVTLHNQYILGYYMPDDAECGKYRKIKVLLTAPVGTPELHMYARSGYYVPER